MSHNSNDGLEPATAIQPDLPFKLAGTYAKTAKAISLNIERMAREDGIDSMLFATFTVGDDDSTLGFVQCWDHPEASRRVNSLATGLLSDIFKRWVLVTERHKNGAIHFHLVGSLASGADVRSGFNHEAVKHGDYSSANKTLRDLWALMRERLPGYGFGRAQFTPIKSTAEAIANYVGKYIEKNLFNRLPEDRRKKLVRYGGWKKSHCRANDFGWATPRAIEWRRKCARIAAIASMTCPGDVRLGLGNRWAWRMSKIMAAVARPGDPEFMADWTDAMQAEEADVWLATHILSNARRVSEALQKATVLNLAAADSEASALRADEGSIYFDPWEAAAA